VEALAKALKDYAGTIFFISHDRTFVNLIASYILEVKNGKIVKYPGKYEDYVDYLERQADEEFAPYRQGPPKKTAKSPAGNPASGKKDQSSQSQAAPSGAMEEAEAKKKIKADIQELTKKIQKIENRISHNKTERDKLQEEMAKNPFFDAKVRGQKLKELNSLIQEDEAAWMDLSEKLEKLKPE
jgi:ATP-binding cassette, subfamily F, member 3